MRLKDRKEAIEQAQANADRSGAPWYVFSDQNSQWRAESSKPANTFAVKVNPRGVE
jgi:hypothetical protein